MNFAAGECAYADAANDNPWCSTVAGATAFVGAAGAAGSNWDYCTCGEFYQNFSWDY